jgi:hypothetical protein
MIAHRLASCCLLAAMPVAALAKPTEIVVRVLSQDAKFVGDLTGGARVTLRNVADGRVLAQGTTRGGTGDTALVMDATGRSPIRQSPETASFRALIDLDVPTLLDLEVEGPLARPQSMIRVVSQRWIMPGQPVDAGNGWMVELPGLAITPSATRQQGSLAVAAKVELMCGCPITPDGRWKASDYQVDATLWQSGRQIAAVPLSFASAPGNYAGTLTLPKADGVRLVISARNIVTGNSGVAQIPVT